MGERVAMGFRVNKVLWNKFKNNVKDKGFSTCFIMETLIRGYLCGEYNKSAHPEKLQKIVVNQNITYEVARARRRKGLHYAENCYLNGMWSFRKPEKNEDLNKLGHVTECRCSYCIPYVSRAHRNRLRSIQ